MKKPSVTAIWLLRAALFIACSGSILIGRTVTYIEYVWVAAYLALNLNDILRVRYLKNRRVLYGISFVISVLGSGILLYYAYSTATAVYFFFTLVEIILGSAKFPLPAVLLHFSIYLVSQYIQLRSQLWMLLLIYAFVVMIVLQFRSNKFEKQKIVQLNLDLQSANARLQAYAENVKKISVVEERTRIAQELHDSIGHGLVALGMNLEFAENVMGKDTVKAKVAIHRAQLQSKKCLDDLRSAVTALKNSPTENSMGLKESISELFDSFHDGEILFHLSFNNRVELMEPEMKDCIYKAVREAVTNGIRHGKANDFTIDISLSSSLMKVSIKDNGHGSGEIVKSHGLTGIENRTVALGGSTSYSFSETGGFEVKLEIPYVNKERGDVL
ncbi:MAG: sensor histidine kinase [Bacillota bacterium]|nr:sensor histidine kinase [Bacillota bacterium]